MKNYVDAGLSIDQTLRWSAYYAGENADSNKETLDKLSNVYMVAVIALGVVVLGFALALAA